MIGVSVGLFGTVRAQYHLRQILVSLNMFPINQPEVMIGNAGTAFNEKGALVDEASQLLVAQLIVNLAAWTRRLYTR